MAKRIAINGFGRIGRLAFRTLWENPKIDIVAINDLTDPNTLAHLLKYDSAHRRFTDMNNNEFKVVAGKNFIKVGDKTIKVFAERNAADLPWKEEKIDLVIESTGFYVSKEKSQAHIDAGAKKVVITAPAKGDLKTIVYGVNHKEITKADQIISGASCTTNCLTPIAKVLDDAFTIKSGFMTTVHAFTNDQKTADAPHPDLRRARAASQNIIPTTTGAAVAVAKALPQLAGKLDGMAMRVPIVTGSVVDVVFTFEDKGVNVEKINKEIKKASNSAALKATIGYTEDPIVSSDIIGISEGTYFDASLTKELKVANGDNAFKIVTWYDNEMSYVNQLCRTILHFIK